MIRLVLLILVICISGLTKVAENEKVFSINLPQLKQAETSPKLNPAEQPVLYSGIIETNTNKPNSLINNHKQLILHEQFADIFNISGFYNEEINLPNLIRKDHIFLSVLQI